MERLADTRATDLPAIAWRTAGPLFAPPRLSAEGAACDAVAVLSCTRPVRRLKFELAGPDRDGFRVSDISRTQGVVTVRIHATEPRTAPMRAVVRAEAEAGHGREACELALQVAPFVLTPACRHVREVLCVRARGASAFCAALAQALSDTPVTVTRIRHPRRGSRDYWIRDAFAAGFFAHTDVRGAIHGLRGPFGPLHGARLDDVCARLLAQRGYQILRVGSARPRRRWIDWYGNIVVSPPLAKSPDGPFPYGRIILGQQGELLPNADLLAFLAAQGEQWPPLVIDTSWLYIGHADELVSFVPRADGAWAALVPSTDLGLAMVDRLACGPSGDVALFRGRGPIHWWFTTPVRHLASHRGLRRENERVAAKLGALRSQLIAELGFSPEQIIEVPALFNRGRSVWPNLVNGLALADRYIAPDPSGPIVDGVDPVKEALTRALDAIGVRTQFIPDFAPHHLSGGDVHCATNTC